MDGYDGELWTLGLCFRGERAEREDNRSGSSWILPSPPTSWLVTRHNNDDDIHSFIFSMLYSSQYEAASQQQLLVRYSWGAHYELWAHIIIGIFYLFPSWESVSSINKIPAQCDGVTGEQVRMVRMLWWRQGEQKALISPASLCRYQRNTSQQLRLEQILKQPL